MKHLLPLLVFAWIVAVVAWSDELKKEKPKPKIDHKFGLTPKGDDAGGVTKGPGFQISWLAKTAGVSKNPNQLTASPADILSATIARLEFLQSTPQASDQTARALWHLMQAQDVFLGREIDQKNPSGLGQPTELKK